MLRKLRAESDVYDATCLIVASWQQSGFSGVTVPLEPVPPDFRADAFLSTLVEAVLSRTPVDTHVTVRRRRENRELPVSEADPAAE